VQLLLQLPLSLLRLVDLFFFLFVELLLLLQTLLDPNSELVFVLGLFIADFISLRAFEIVPDVLRGAELPAYFDLLLDFIGLVLDLDGRLIVVDACKS
jgi:hypothetical protein